MFHHRYYYGRAWLGISQTFHSSIFGDGGVCECTTLETNRGSYDQDCGTDSLTISVSQSKVYRSFFNQMTYRMTRHYHITNV